jgi:hypothetical protein
VMEFKIHHTRAGRWSLAGFLDREDFTTLIGPTLAAGAVRQLALVAVGALGESGGGEEVVAAAFCGALLGVAPFWIRHCGIPFASPGARAKARDAERKTCFLSA